MINTLQELRNIQEEERTKRNHKYQHALNDVIKNAGTAYKCKNESFYLLQELCDMYADKIINEEEKR